MQRPPVQTKSITFSSSAFSMHCRFGNIDQTGNSLEQIPLQLNTSKNSTVPQDCWIEAILYLYLTLYLKRFYIPYIYKKKLSVRVVVDNTEVYMV